MNYQVNFNWYKNNILILQQRYRLSHISHEECMKDAFGKAIQFYTFTKIDTECCVDIFTDCQPDKFTKIDVINQKYSGFLFDINK